MIRPWATTVPDLKMTVVQRLVVGDRVVSHLCFTGHFTGTFQGRRITDNWHLEDNLTFLKQVGFFAAR